MLCGHHCRFLPSGVRVLAPNQVVRFAMKPLSLHRRVHDPVDTGASKRDARAVNSLILQGSFAMQVVHDWLAMCLPDVPPRLDM